PGDHKAAAKDAALWGCVRYKRRGPGTGGYHHVWLALPGPLDCRETQWLGWFTVRTVFRGRPYRERNEGENTWRKTKIYRLGKRAGGLLLQQRGGLQSRPRRGHPDQRAGSATAASA